MREVKNNQLAGDTCRNWNSLNDFRGRLIYSIFYWSYVKLQTYFYQIVDNETGLNNLQLCCIRVVFRYLANMFIRNLLARI